MFSLINNLPEILRESGSLFGVFALVAIIIALIVVFFFRNSETRQKERVFLYTALFLLVLVFSALIAGVSTGYESGVEIATEQTKGDPSGVALSPSTVESLESYLTEQGQPLTDENKSKVLSEALTDYLQPSELAEAPTPVVNEPKETAVDVSSSKGLAPDGFEIVAQGCEQSDRTVTCDALVTNTKKDVSMALFADSSIAGSRLIDQAGNQYVATIIRVGSEEDDSQQSVTFAQNVPVKVTLSASDVQPEASTVALMEIFGSTDWPFTKVDVSFQSRDIPIRR